ncbi:MlaA family lipoprotein [Croceicoccus bisphenolivorans]|uniref:MlaA family lipoprotein n=1 Tax=Croceicoccus bisphenolivorans TaxID=1783232 RepID=UPI000831AC6E|nr:VacJ family lipoprotein [Croceicoccus bisphenolivorans]
MVVSVLALTVSLAHPRAACARDIDCVARPASPSADAAMFFDEPGHARFDLDRVRAVQEEPAPDPAGSAGSPDAVAIAQEDEPDPAEGDENVIIVEGATEAPAGDPAEKLNAATFQAVQAVDSAIVEPIANAYDKALPTPLRKGLRNFLRNLGEPISFVNFLLQLKPGKAMKTLGRFAINTTIGIAGVFDVASKEPFGLEYEYNGLANTLGYYGVGPGPYLYLPFIGATSLRDLTGRMVDFVVVPTLVGKPFNDPYIALPISTLTSLESRIDTDAEIDAIRSKCGDPYAATRDLYLIQRQVEIDRLRGRVRADLGELEERLEFNCDIEIETGVVPKGKKGFIEGNTTLLKGEEENLPEADSTDAKKADAIIEDTPAHDAGAVEMEPVEASNP